MRRSGASCEPFEREGLPFNTEKGFWLRFRQAGLGHAGVTHLDQLHAGYFRDRVSFAVKYGEIRGNASGCSAGPDARVDINLIAGPDAWRELRDGDGHVAAALSFREGGAEDMEARIEEDRMNVIIRGAGSEIFGQANAAERFPIATR